MLIKQKNIRRLLKLKTKKISIHKKYYHDIYDCIKHYKDWMFFDNDMYNVEILPPSIDNLKLMSDFNLCFVVKGFTSLVEYNYANKLRVKHGITMCTYMTTLVGANFIASSLENYFNQNIFPSDSEIKKEVDNNFFIEIKDEHSIKKHNTRKYLLKKYKFLTVKLHKYISQLIKEKRVEKLNVIV